MDSNFAMLFRDSTYRIIYTDPKVGSDQSASVCAKTISDALNIFCDMHPLCFVTSFAKV